MPCSFFQWQIGLGDTACYRFKTPPDVNNNSNSSDVLDRRGSIEVTFLSLRSVHAISNAYHFRLAAARAECLCDCPGGKGQCHKDFDG